MRSLPPIFLLANTRIPVSRWRYDRHNVPTIIFRMTWWIYMYYQYYDRCSSLYKLTNLWLLLMYLVTVSYFEMKIRYTIITCVQKNSSNLILTICGVHQVVHCIEIYQLNVIYIVLPLLQICSSMKKIWIDKPRATVPSIQKNLQFTTNKKYASSGLNNLISLNVLYKYWIPFFKKFWDILLLRYRQFTCIWYSFINTITGPVK